MDNWLLLLLDRCSPQCAKKKKKRIYTQYLIYQVDRNDASDDVLSQRSVCVCVYSSVLVCLRDARRLWDISLCHWGCNLSSHPLSPWKTGKLKILLCISRRHTCLAHTHTVRIHSQNAEMHSPTYKHPSVSLIMLTPTAKLCRRHLIPDSSAISWHKPTQMRLHSCTHTKTLHLSLPLPQWQCQDIYWVLLVWKELYRDVSPPAPLLPVPQSVQPVPKSVTV